MSQGSDQQAYWEDDRDAQPDHIHPVPRPSLPVTPCPALDLGCRRVDHTTAR